MIARSRGPRSTRKPGTRSLTLGCGGTVLVLGMGLLAYVGWANTLPPPEPQPIRVLPRPNGYDACADAVAKLSGLGAAVFDQHWTADPDALRRELAGIQPQLRVLKAAVRLPYVSPDFGLTRGTDYRHAGRILASKARVELVDGKTGDALESSLEAIELGVKFQKGGPWVDSLTGAFLARTGHRAMEPCINRATAAEIHMALNRLDGILAKYPHPADVMESERLQTLRDLRPYLATPGQINVMAIRDVSEPSWVLRTKSVAAGVFYPRPWAYRRIDGYYRSICRELRKPLRLRTPPATFQDPVVGDQLSFEDYQTRLLKPLAELRLLRMQLSLREYYLSTGQLPASLQELKIDLEAEIARDPFSESHFQYRKKGTGYVLYSLGPDGNDNGGNPVPRSDLGKSWAKGDLVVGQLFPSSKPNRP